MSLSGVRAMPVVPQGPRAFRYRIRRLGTLAALLPAAALGGAAFLLLRDNTTTIRGLLGFACAVLAAPAMLAFGVPLTNDSSHIALGIAVSAGLWLVIGFVAARRATRSPVATWRDYWREYLWLAAGAWLGVVAALVVIEIVLGPALL